ncbi:hypothetical protein CcaCcLH18_02332 [Colletotrichum camelliae]|nr:hypothetical protein CcaCcLH18_02332 [Colletotrichum camelliae]
MRAALVARYPICVLHEAGTPCQRITGPNQPPPAQPASTHTTRFTTTLDNLDTTSQSLQPIAHYRAALLPPSCTCDLAAAAAPDACPSADRGAIDRPTGEPQPSIRLPERRTAPREVNCKGHVSVKFFSADFAFVDTHSPLIDIPLSLPHDRGIISAS